jgi:hypothetical protein
VNRRAGPAHDHWLTLLPLFIAVVATATLVIG